MAFSHFAQQYQQFLILDGGDMHIQKWRQPDISFNMFQLSASLNRWKKPMSSYIDEKLIPFASLWISFSLSLGFLSHLQILNSFWEYDCEWQAYYLHFPCCCGQLCSLESLFLLMIVLPATTACSPPPFVLLSYSSFCLSFYQFLTILDEKERDTMAAVCSRLGCAVVYCVIRDPSKKIKWGFRMIAITQCSLLPKRNEHFSWLLRQSCTRSPGQTVMRAS